MSGNFYYGRDADIVSGSANFAARILASPVSYGLSEPQATAFGVLNTSLQGAYSAAVEPATRTPVAIEQKNLAIADMRASAINLAKIAYSTATVSDAQLIELGLLPRSTRSPVGPPAERPSVDVSSVAARTVTVHIHSGSSARRGKLPGTTGALVYSFTGVEYPSDPAAWTFEGLTSRPRFEIVFPNTVAGGTQVWICAAWVNARAQSGPVSIPISTNLQGGGSSAEGDLKIAA